MNNSLVGQIRLFAALPTLLALLLTGGFFIYQNHQEHLSSAIHNHQLLLNSYAKQLQSELSQNSSEAVLNQLAQELLEQEDVRAVTITLDNTTKVHAGPRMRGQLNRLENGSYETDMGWRWLDNINDDALLEIEFTHQRIQIMLMESLLIAIGLIFLAISFTVVTSHLLARRLLSPLERITHAINRVTQGDLSNRIGLHGHGELRTLQKAINDMCSALENSQEELRQNVEQATEDLRETLETVEVQNIELDMARKEAVKASQIKSEFLANMSHEIRTPLNGIVGFTRLLMRSDVNSRQKDYLGTIQKSSDALLSIINDILDFSKIEAGKLELEQVSLSLQDIIEEVQTMLAPQAQDKGLEQAAIFYQDVPEHIIGDPLRIRQIITNLVSNAIKFTNSGSVVVRAMLEEKSSDRAMIKVTVTDTGPGMTMETQRTLFQPFTQADQSISRKNGGSGLGLTISKYLVEEMGGEIGLESRKGTGSTFWFTLSASIDDQSVSNNIYRAFENIPVVIAEMEEHAGLGLHHMLNNWGAVVTDLQRFEKLPETLASQASKPLLILGLPSDGHLNNQVDPLIENIDGDVCLGIVLLSSHPERIAESLPTTQMPMRLLGKPASRLRLYDALLEVSGEQSSENHIENQPSPHQGKQILVVDDHPGNLQLAKVFLEDLGTQVITCNSGLAALEAFKAEQFDAIFMDIQMPEMGGLEATQHIRKLEEQGQHTPIIALTAHALSSEKHQLLEKGMDDYLTKPVNEQHLDQMLKKWAADNHKKSVPTTPSIEASFKDKDTSDGMAIFDQALALKRCANKSDLMQDMHRMLWQQLQQDHEAMQISYDKGLFEQLLEQVHKLHGATRYCGTPRLEKASGTLEAALKKQSSQDIIHTALVTLLEEITSVINHAEVSAMANATA